MSGQRRDVTRVLSVVAAGSAALLGIWMLIGGLGLAFAIATSTQAPLQVTTAGILILTGAMNLWASLQLWKQKARALTASAVATGLLVAYLTVIGDLGEPLLLHALHLSLLAAIAYRTQALSRLPT
jgi:hypothetical protein